MQLELPEPSTIAVIIEVTDNCDCGNQSDYGAHGIRDGEIYDEYYCEECWSKRK